MNDTLNRITRITFENFYDPNIVKKPCSGGFERNPNFKTPTIYVNNLIFYFLFLVWIFLEKFSVKDPRRVGRVWSIVITQIC